MRPIACHHPDWNTMRSRLILTSPLARLTFALVANLAITTATAQTPPTSDRSNPAAASQSVFQNSDPPGGQSASAGAQASGAAGTTMAPMDAGAPQRPTLTNGRAAPYDPRAIGNRAVTTEPGRAVQGPPELPAVAALERSEFQDFIEKSIGKLLPRFGANLFSGSPSTFAPVDNVPITADYLIGPGDEIRIRVWGQVEGESRSMVDRDGNIDVPKVGTLAVAGVRMDALEGHIRAAIERNFRNFELNVTLGTLRSIQIFVVGQARRPGSYTVSALSTLVTALFASGGPNATGSMRRIQLKRNDKLITEFDVYDFLARGDKSKDARLLAGDVIFIPTEGPQVALSGSVKVPAVFELKESTSLRALVDLAGGLTATARGQKAMVERIDDRRVRRVEEFTLDEAGLDKPVKDGDLVSILPISPRFENAVTLRGNVAMPLRYPYRDGMRISDLIPEREALVVPDYFLKRNLITRLDAIDEKQRSAVEIKNANQLIAEFQRAVAEINWDYAVIERLDLHDLSQKLYPFNLGKAVIDHDPAQDLTLQPGDVVTIFSKADFGVPLNRRTVNVVLEGEFNSPGVYTAKPGESLRQMVSRTGGLGPDSYLFGAVFTRESTRVTQQKALDEVINRMEADLQRSSVNKAQNAQPSDSASVAQEIALQQAQISRLRQLKAEGRIILNLPESPRLSDLPDLQLENGDRLQLPPKPATINVLGSVYNTGSFVHRPGQRVDEYLQTAGGPLRSADAGATYVLRADGSVLSKRQASWGSRFDSITLMPGDSIVVPEDYEHTTWMKSLREYSQIFFQFALGAAAIKVLKN